jgi:hypothetical protein
MMNISGLPSTTANMYLEYLTGNNNATSIASDSSDTTTTPDPAATYLDEAAQGQQLPTDGQAAAQQALTDSLVAQLLDISV